jgi:hypothetical protein
MLAWLSATNLPPSADTSPSSEVALSEPMRGGDAVPLADGAEDAGAITPAAASAKPDATGEQFGTAAKPRS